MTASQHTIAGTVLTMPVKIRKANQHMAMFSVDADAAQQLIDYSGLQVCRYLPGRAIVALILTALHRRRSGPVPRIQHLRDGQSPRLECGRARPLQSGAFIHHLLVDQAFTLEAGQTIWGFPKVMADFTVRDGKQFGFDVSIDGQLAIGMEFQPGPSVSVGVHVTGAGVARVLASRRCDTQKPLGHMSLPGVCYRLGGARVSAWRSSLRERTRLAWLAETRPCLEFCCQRKDVVRRRTGLSAEKGAQ